MAHSNQRRNQPNNRGGRGQQAQNAPRLPVFFDKGEEIWLTFADVPVRGGGTTYGALLSDGSIVEPGTYRVEGFEYHFRPEPGKTYVCSVMGQGRCSALPKNYRELSASEWVCERIARKCLTGEGVFQMSDERNSRLEPRPYTMFEGRRVFLERGFESTVRLGETIRFSVVEPPNANGNRFAVPLTASAPAAKPAPKASPRLDPPVQPADPLLVTWRQFERKPDTASVRTVADCTVKDKQVSIYQLLTVNQHGIVTTASSDAATVRDHASRIEKGLLSTLNDKTQVLQRQQVLSRIDAVQEAALRALAALGETESDDDGEDEAEGEVPEATETQAEATDAGPKPAKKRNRKRNRKGRGTNGVPAPKGDVAPAAQPVVDAAPSAPRAASSSTLGDVIGGALSKVRTAAPGFIADRSSRSQAPAAEVSEEVSEESEDETVAPASAPTAVTVDENAKEFLAMMRDLKCSAAELKAGIINSGKSLAEFNGMAVALKKHHLRAAKSSKKSA